MVSVLVNDNDIAHNDQKLFSKIAGRIATEWFRVVFFFFFLHNTHGTRHTHTKKHQLKMQQNGQRHLSPCVHRPAFLKCTKI